VQRDVDIDRAAVLVLRSPISPLCSFRNYSISLGGSPFAKMLPRLVRGAVACSHRKSFVSAASLDSREINFLAVISWSDPNASLRTSVARAIT
jgi:hypothetical protein